MASQPNDHLIDRAVGSLTDERPGHALEHGIDHTIDGNSASNDADQALTVKAPKPVTLPYSFAKRHGVLIDLNGESGPQLVHKPGVTNMALLEARRAAGISVTLHRVDENEFDQLLTRNYEGNTSDAMTVMDDFDGELDLDRMAESLEPEDLMESQDDAPIIRLINAMLTEAIRKGASDVHIEPFEHRLSVRYRVDGVMNKLLEPPQQAAAQVISRIKVMAKLDIAEKRLPQDGRISLRVAGRPVDVRVSTLPSGHGERVVMRLLDKQAGRLNLENLGMSDTSSELLQSVLKMPHGIVLVTGPTGSGKTTSLYAAMTKLNNSRNTILTVEDPIEYYLDGIGQTQVNTKVDLTFARGLRAILRQDPDIVMVGEIRDLETAEIAVQASLTGHLVLSTLHTNTAIGSITRLRDMGVEPFLLSSSLIGLVAQRLVRLLCSDCKKEHLPSTAERQQLGLQDHDDAVIYLPHGCNVCNHSGYIGRTGIYEVDIVDETIRNMIHDGAAEHEIESYARSQFPGISDDGKRLVLKGLTSYEEVLRVTREM